MRLSAPTPRPPNLADLSRQTFVWADDWRPPLNRGPGARARLRPRGRARERRQSLPAPDRLRNGRRRHIPPGSLTAPFAPVGTMPPPPRPQSWPPFRAPRLSLPPSPDALLRDTAGRSPGLSDSPG